MYPITEQLIKYAHADKNNKIGMLILDVKGNYCKEVTRLAQDFNREDDLIIINLGGNYKYNPLDKPTLKPSVIANQLKEILLLFSPNNSESFWLDKCQTILQEAIKLCRIYNDGYVTFLELHKLITSEKYYKEKVSFIRDLFVSGKLSKDIYYDLITAMDFFEKEFLSLDERNKNILKSEITRITNPFVSDKEVLDTFCPKREKLNFKGFYELVHSGKILVLDMNINEYRSLSKIIAAYLKIDFQTEVLRRLSSEEKPYRKVAFISDEYSEYVTSLDANFFSQSREANCINVVATQSYTSILNTLKDKYTTEVIIQSLVNKLWFRSDDIYTIESAQKLIGRSNQEFTSKTISESAKETSYSYLTNSLRSKNSNLSESFNTSIHKDFIYEVNSFSQDLETFSAIAFISDGYKILPPSKIYLKPYFRK